MAILPSGLADTVNDEEDLARYLVSSRQFNSLMVKPAAFMPDPRDGQRSVFRHGEEPRARLWELALQYAVRDRRLHGAAILRASRVREAGLEVEAQEPPPRHANIVGWPWSATDPQFGQAETKLKAAVLAEHAELVRYPTNVRAER